MADENFDNAAGSQGADGSAGEGGTDNLNNSSTGDSYATGGSDDNQAQAAEFSIPEEYKEKDWVKSFEGKSGDDLKSELFKTLDDKFSNSPEIPETVEGYNLNEFKYQGDNNPNEFEYPDEILGSFGETFKDLKLSKEQAHGLLNSYMDFELKNFEKISNQEDLDRSVDEMFKGNNEEKTTVQNLLKEFVPREDMEYIKDFVPNNVVMMFYKVARGLVDKYGYKEGAGGQGSQNNYRMTQADKDKEYNRICDEMEALNRRPHTTEEKEGLQRQLDALFR